MKNAFWVLLIIVLFLVITFTSCYYLQHHVDQSGKDKLISPEGCFTLMSEAPSDDKTLLYCNEAWHDITHEKEIWQVLDRTVEWMNDKVKLKPIDEDEEDQKIKKYIDELENEKN